MKLIKEFIYNRFLYRIINGHPTATLIDRGMKVGDNFSRQEGVILDPSHCRLIEIGNNVTLAPRVHILCHDASTNPFLHYTKVGRVTIGDHVFIGAESVILPGVTIGNNVIIGANSTVTHDIPPNSVAVGSPARVICTLEDYLNKEKERMTIAPIFGSEYTLEQNIPAELRQRQKEQLTGTIGYIG